jgi:hypothetical protein
MASRWIKMAESLFANMAIEPLFAWKRMAGAPILRGSGHKHRATYLCTSPFFPYQAMLGWL